MTQTGAFLRKTPVDKSHFLPEISKLQSNFGEFQVLFHQALQRINISFVSLRTLLIHSNKISEVANYTYIVWFHFFLVFQIHETKDRRSYKKEGC